MDEQENGKANPQKEPSHDVSKKIDETLTDAATTPLPQDPSHNDVAGAVTISLPQNAKYHMGGDDTLPLVFEDESTSIVSPMHSENSIHRREHQKKAMLTDIAHDPTISNEIEQGCDSSLVSSIKTSVVSKNAKQDSGTSENTLINDSSSVVQDSLSETKVQRVVNPVANSQEKLGPYTLQGLLGVGGMGKVYKAYHPSLDRTVAIKVMLRKGAENSRERARFLAEAQLAAKLQHPNIVAIHDVGSDQDMDYIVMEFIPGISLLDYIATEHPNTRRSLEIVLEIAVAMEYAHQQGIIHRDLKPANILLHEQTHHAIVTDFGLAKNMANLAQLTQSGETLGTPRYMSPEQAIGDNAQISAQTDVYSLGAILYEMLTGKQAVHGDTAGQIICNVIYQEVIPPRQYNPKLSPELEIISLKALAKDKSQRYFSAGAFADDIRHFLNGEMILARPPSLLYRASRFVKKNYYAFVSSCIFILLIVCSFLGYGYIQQQQISEDVILIEQKLASNVTYNAFLQKYPHLSKNEDISFSVEDEIKQAIQYYQVIKSDLERILILVPNHPQAKQYLYETEKEIGLLAMLLQNFLLAELSLERCRNWQNTAEIVDLFRLLQKRKLEQKQQKQNLLREHMQNLQKQRSLPLVAQSEALVAEFLSSYTLVKKPTEYDLKEMIEAQAEIISLLEKAYVINPESVLKKQLAEAQRNVGVLAWIGNDYLLGQIFLEKYKKLGHISEASVLLHKLQQQKREKLEKNQKTIAESLEESKKALAIVHTLEDNLTQLQQTTKQDAYHIQQLRQEILLAYITASDYLAFIVILDPSQQKIKEQLYEMYKKMGFLGKEMDNDVVSLMAFRSCEQLLPSSESKSLVLQAEQRIKNKNITSSTNNALAGTVLQDRVPVIKSEEIFQQANEAYQKGHWDIAINKYTQIIAMDPKFANVYTQRGMAYLQKGEYTLAIDDLTIAITKNSKDSYAYMYRGMAYDRQQKYSEAEQDYNRAWAMGIQKNPQLYLLRGMVYFCQGKVEQSIREYTQAIGLNAKYTEAYYARGMAYKKLNKTDLALRDMQMVLHYDSKSEKAAMELAKWYMDQEKYPQAITHLDKIILLHPNNLLAMYLRGMAHLETQNLGKAEADFSKVILIQSDFADAYKGRALVYAKMQKHTLAIPDVKKYLMYAKEDPDIPKLKAYLEKYQKQTGQ